MNTLAIFGLQFGLSLLVYSFFAKWYIAPWLQQKPRQDALAYLLVPHATRHLGMVFLVPGVVGESIPSAFANAAAYGDLISGLLAFLSIAVLRKCLTRALPLVWIFSIVGMLDLVNALRQANVVVYLDAAWYIPTFVVPMLLVTHVLIFKLLLNKGARS